jgi:hypothetical protein
MKNLFLSTSLLALTLSNVLITGAAAADGELTVDTQVVEDHKAHTTVTVTSGGELRLTDSTIGNTLTVEGSGIAHLRGTTIEAPATGKTSTSCISDTAVATFQSTTINSSELTIYNTSTATFSDKCSAGSLSLSGSAMVTVTNRNLTNPCSFADIELSSTNRLSFAGDGTVWSAPSSDKPCYLTVSPTATVQLGWIVESIQGGNPMVPFLQNTQITMTLGAELPPSSYTVVVSLVQSYMGTGAPQSDFSGLLARYNAATTQTPSLPGIPIASFAAGSHAPKAFALELLTGFTEDGDTKKLTYQTTPADFSKNIADDQKRFYRFRVVNSPDSLNYYLSVEDTTPASLSSADFTAMRALVKAETDPVQTQMTTTGGNVAALSSRVEEVSGHTKTLPDTVADVKAVKDQVSALSGSVEEVKAHATTLLSTVADVKDTKDQVTALAGRVEEVSGHTKTLPDTKDQVSALSGSVEEVRAHARTLLGTVADVKEIKDQLRDIRTLLGQVNALSQGLAEVLIKLQQQQMIRDHQILTALQDVQEDVRQSYGSQRGLAFLPGWR